jgi:restriction system protein
MFKPTGGYLWLDSWALANLVQLGTQRFCVAFLNRANDPCGRQFDQMTQAARSGCANIAEGSARRQTSKETEMTLTDVARASLSELAGDYLNWLLSHGQVPWAKDSPEARAVYAVRLDAPRYGSDAMHDACLRILAEKQKFALWLDSGKSEVAANALLILIARVINMLNHQLETQGEIFKQEGGFRENLSKVRLEARDAQQQAAGVPLCPQCGKPMRKKIAQRGRNAGQAFWSCTAYPDCKGTRSCTEASS